MLRGSGGLILVIGSLFYIFAGCYKLLQFKKYIEFAFVFTFYFGTALLLSLGFTYSWNLDVPNMRVWAVTPFIFLLMFWLISGFFVRKYVAKIIYGIRTAKARLKIRMIGAILFIVGLGIWLYGNFNPFNESIFIWALLFSVICMASGIPYLFTGRKFSEIDYWTPDD